MNKLVVLGAFISMFLPVVTSAHDVFLPDWRDLEGTTYQEWRFDNATTPAVPEVINNDYGIAMHQLPSGRWGQDGWMIQC